MMKKTNELLDKYSLQSDTNRNMSGTIYTAKDDFLNDDCCDYACCCCSLECCDCLMDL